MLRIIVFIVSIFTLFCIAYLLGSEWKRSASLLIYGDLNFGVVPAGVKVTKKISIENRGSREVRIARVASGCGCTEVSLLADSTIFPGDRTEIAVSMLLDEGNSASGKSVDIHILTDNPSVPSLKMTAVAAPSIDDQGFPAVIDFGDVPDDSLPRSKSFRRRRLGKEHRNWVAHIENSDFLSVSQVDEDLGLEFQVSLSKSTPTGELYVPVKFESENAPSEEIIVRGVVRGRFRLSPGFLAIGPIEPSNPQFEERVKLRWNDSSLPASAIQSVTLSQSLEGIIKATVLDSDTPVISLSHDFSASGSFFASRTIIGAVQVVAQSEDTKETINLPIILSIKTPRQK